jgi:adenylate kinase family enzyme/RimJ/RimL family protein N-acetyltransferase
MNIAFRPLKHEDLSLMHTWFQQDDIRGSYARGEIFDEKMIEEKYLPRILNQEPIPSFIIEINHKPCGFIQYYSLKDYLPEGMRTPENPIECAGIDLFIAEAQYRGKGLGPKVIQKFIYSFLYHYKYIFLDPHVDNQVAIHAFQKAGFEITDLSLDPAHLILRYQPKLKIMIIGRPGSGKSTTAKKLHQFLKIPLYHLDKFFFLANWQARSEAEFLKIKSNFLHQPEWIIDGNATKSFELRYQYATHCLYFNFPRYLCYWRIIKRLFNKDMAIDDRALGCKETIRWYLVQYTWSFEARVADKLKKLKEKYPQTIFIELKNQKELITFLKGFSR